MASKKKAKAKSKRKNSGQPSFKCFTAMFKFKKIQQLVEEGWEIVVDEDAENLMLKKGEESFGIYGDNMIFGKTHFGTQNKNNVSIDDFCDAFPNALVESIVKVAKKLEMNDETATIWEDGTVEYGCTTLESADVRKIYDELKKIFG
jgi:hypothetical protein